MASFKMTGSMIENKMTINDNDSDVIVGDKKESSDMKAFPSFSESRETLSDVVVNESKDVIIESEDQIITVSNTELDDNSITRELVEDVKIKDQETKSNLQQVLERPLSKDFENLSEESSDVLEIKTLMNKLLKMDYYESNKVVPVPTPRKIRVSQKTKVSLNPFSSDEDEDETLTQPLSPKPKRLSLPMIKLTHDEARKMKNVCSVSSYPNTPRKKKRAPLPPIPKNSLQNHENSNSTHVMSSIESLKYSSYSGSNPSSVTCEDRHELHNNTHGKGKRHKGSTPQCQIAQARRSKSINIEDIKEELLDIEIKQQELEKQGIVLEKDIRCNKNLNNIDVEQIVLQSFKLANEKNELFRRHAKLIYLRRRHQLEDHAELEHQIRVLMTRPSQTKMDTEKMGEEQLVQRLVEVVKKQNKILKDQEKDRMREDEDDHIVLNQIGTFAQVEPLPCNNPVADNIPVMNRKKNLSKKLFKIIKKMK